MLTDIQHSTGAITDTQRPMDAAYRLGPLRRRHTPVLRIMSSLTPRPIVSSSACMPTITRTCSRAVILRCIPMKRGRDGKEPERHSDRFNTLFGMIVLVRTVAAPPVHLTAARMMTSAPSGPKGAAGRLRVPRVSRTPCRGSCGRATGGSCRGLVALLPLRRPPSFLLVAVLLFLWRLGLGRRARVVVWILGDPGLLRQMICTRFVRETFEEVERIVSWKRCGHSGLHHG